jgi:hypothetical protein
MGDELRHARRQLDVVDARLNPDVDKLDRVELVVLGDVSARIGRQQRSPSHAEDAHRGPQHVGGARAPRCGGTAVHHRRAQRPIHVIVDDQPSWKAQGLAELVQYQRAQLNGLLTVPVDPNSDLEAWRRVTRSSINGRSSCRI